MAKDVMFIVIISLTKFNLIDPEMVSKNRGLFCMSMRDR